MNVKNTECIYASPYDGSNFREQVTRHNHKMKHGN